MLNWTLEERKVLPPAGKGPSPFAIPLFGGVGAQSPRLRLGENERILGRFAEFLTQTGLSGCDNVADIAAMRQLLLMPATIVRESRLQAIVRFLGCTALGGVAIWGAKIIPSPAKQAALYCGAAFFAILSLRYIWSACCPGMLAIGPDGITQNLGWRRLYWAWSDIDRTEVIRTAGGLASVCIIYPRVGGLVRLFGWTFSAEELQWMIDEYRKR